MTSIRTSGERQPGVQPAPPLDHPTKNDLSDRIALERAADKAHMEYLVASVAAQLLAVSLPGVGATAADMQEWAITRARNVLCGLMGERL